MSDDHIAAHYTRGNLWERLQAALRDDGVDPSETGAKLLNALAPYDHFHGRGREATEELAASLRVSPDDELLDVGSGIGGPARFMAMRFGVRVIGIDLTAEFCQVAALLSSLTGLAERTSFIVGDATAMPVASGRFAGAYSMNVSMNIADRAAFYAELARVLMPGGWLALSELARGPTSDLSYPTPWAADAASSFLCTAEETSQGLGAAGFELVSARNTLEEARAYAARSRAAVEAGGKPLYRAVQLIHGDAAAEMAKNAARAYLEGAIVPIEFICRKVPLAGRREGVPSPQAIQPLD